MSERDDQQIEVLEDAAIEWIARLRASDVTDAERADFAAWLAEDQRHVRAFDDMAALWGLTGELDPVELPEPHAVEPQAPATARWLPMALAASIMVAVASFLMLDYGAVYETDLGEQRRVVLDDGTTMYLNTATAVTVSYDDERRQIALEAPGEAYFEVARDPSRPFIVQTPHGEAEALGTAFNVFALKDRTSVAVTEGRVGVSPAASSSRTTLLALQQADLRDARISLGGTRTPDDIAAWRSGRLVYDGITLDAMVRDLNRYLPKPMSLADDSLADMEVSAVLRLQEQDAMLDALTESLDLRWTTVSDNLILLHRR